MIGTDISFWIRHRRLVPVFVKPHIFKDAPVRRRKEIVQQFRPLAACGPGCHGGAIQRNGSDVRQFPGKQKAQDLTVQPQQRYFRGLNLEGLRQVRAN